MKAETFNYVKRVLKDYPDIEHYIKMREEELRYPYRPGDLNDGIKSNYKSDKMGLMLITIDEDRRLTSLQRNKRIIDQLLADCDEDTRTIIEELYMTKFPKFTMTGLVESHVISCSRNTASKKRTYFFEQVAKALNLEL